LKTGKATGEFTQTIKRPVVDVNKALGIRTRGGADYKDITKVTRQLEMDAKTGELFSKETGYRYAGFTDKSGNIKFIDDVGLLNKKTFAKSFDQNAYKVFGNNELKLLEKTKIKNIYSVSQDQKMFRFNGDDIYGFDISRSRFNNFKIKLNTVQGMKGQQTLLYKGDKVLDLDKITNIIDLNRATDYGFGSRATGGTKTFGTGGSYQVDDFVLKLDKASTGSSQSNIVKKVIKQIDKVDDFVSGGQTSQYAGTGQYERTQSFGGLTQQ